MAKENPQDRKYTKEHEWAKVEGDVVTVGITDHAQELLTDIVFVELPVVGKKVEQFKPVAVVESVKSVSDVYASVSGEVVEVNKQLEDQPDLVNKDAFESGWIVKIKMSDPKELDNLMDTAAYNELVESGSH